MRKGEIKNTTSRRFMKLYNENLTVSFAAVYLTRQVTHDQVSQSLCFLTVVLSSVLHSTPSVHHGCTLAVGLNFLSCPLSPILTDLVDTHDA